MKQRTFWLGLAFAVLAGAAAAWAEDQSSPIQPPATEQSVQDALIGILQGSIDAIQLTKDAGYFLATVQTEGAKIAADQLRCSVEQDACRLEKTKRCIAHSQSFANIDAQFKVLKLRAASNNFAVELRAPVDALLKEIEETIVSTKEALTKGICETA